MSFLNPAAFTGLISIPIILAIYLLKQKHTDMVIPSLFLWEKAVLNSQSLKPWQRLRKNILMFLQLLMALLLVLILANPYIKSVQSSENYIYILDASMSMQADDVSPNRFLYAKKQIREAVKGLKLDAKITLLVMAKNPYIAVNQTDDKNIFLSKLDDIDVTNSAVDEEAVKSLMRIVSEAAPANIISYSDKLYDFEQDAESVIIGESVDNIAITAMSHYVDADRIVVLVRLKNFGGASQSRTVSLFTDNKIHDLKEIRLEPFAEADVFFTDVNINSYELRAELSEGDYLAVDDVRYDVVVKSEKQRVLLVTSQNIFLEKVLEALPNIELYKGTEEINRGYYLYVFDGVLPETMPTDGHLLIINPPIGNTFIQTGEETEITNIKAYETELTNFIREPDFVIAKAKKITAPDWAATAISSKETPLIIFGERNNQRVIVIGFDLHASDLPLKKEFPIFMYNLIRWFVPDNIIRAASDGAVDFNISPEAESVKVIAPDGSVSDLAPPFPVLPYDNTDLPGFYILEQTIGGEPYFGSFAINPDTDLESDLIMKGSAGEGVTARLKTSMPSNKSLRQPLIITLIIIFILEWWVYSRDV